MSSLATRLLAGAAAIFLVAGHAWAQDTTAPAETPAAEAPAADTTTTETPAADAATPADDDPVVATVNGAPILRSEVLELVSKLPAQYQQLPPEVLIQAMAEQAALRRLVTEQALASDVGQDPAVIAQITSATNDILGQAWLQAEVDAQMTDEKVQAAYDAMVAATPPEKEVQVRQILLNSEEEANDIIAQLKEGADFAQLADQHAPDGGGQGGELGWLTKGQLAQSAPEFADAAFSMEKGTFSQTPVHTSFGWHVIMVEDERTAPPPSLDQMRPQAENQARQQVLEDILTGLKSSAQIVVIGQEPAATDAPATDAPATDAPAADAPATDTPATEAPATDAPATDAPATDGTAQ